MRLGRAGRSRLVNAGVHGSAGTDAGCCCWGDERRMRTLIARRAWRRLCCFAMRSVLPGSWALCRHVLDFSWMSRLLCLPYISFVLAFQHFFHDLVSVRF